MATSARKKMGIDRNFRKPDAKPRRVLPASERGQRLQATRRDDGSARPFSTLMTTTKFLDRDEPCNKGMVSSVSFHLRRPCSAVQTVLSSSVPPPRLHCPAKRGRTDGWMDGSVALRPDREQILTSDGVERMWQCCIDTEDGIEGAWSRLDASGGERGALRLEYAHLC